MLKTLNLAQIESKTVLLRVDYNVPLDNQIILDDTRIRASLQTISYLLARNPKRLILLSHLGRPEKLSPESARNTLSLRLIANHLQTLLKKPVYFSSLPFNSELQKFINNTPQNSVILLENLRFHPEETKNQPQFAQKIIDTTSADLFIQDGFAVLHRAHTSTSALPQLLPAFAGFLVETELAALNQLRYRPKRPLVFILGGAKIEDKQPLIDHYLNFADQIIVGGKIAASGYTNSHSKIYVAEDFTSNYLDIGPSSTQKITNLISGAGTIIWNGTLGKVEDPSGATASTIIAQVISNSSAFSAICGGDTVGFIHQLQEQNSKLNFSLISTGGGASLEYLISGTLPGLTPISSEI